MHLFKEIKNNIKFWLLSLLIAPLFLWCFCSANPDDLLWQLVEPAYYEETIIWLWTNRDTVWKNVFKWWTSISLEMNALRVPNTDKDGKPICRLGECIDACKEIEPGLGNESLCKRQWEYTWWGNIGAGIEKEPSMIVKITRMLLLLTIALSVTMILYNGMMYIIKTWQWKEGKDVIKNIAYIVIWILIALFSVIIVRIIQSIPSTLANTEELPESTYEQDKAAISQGNWDKRVGVWWKY